MSLEGCPHGPKALWPEGGCMFCAQENAREQVKQEALREQVDAVLAARQLLLHGPVDPSPVNTELKVYTVTAEGWDYDEYDEWCVIATSQEQAFELVRKDSTCLEHYELEITATTPVEPGVAYASFHPG